MMNRTCAIWEEHSDYATNFYTLLRYVDRVEDGGDVGDLVEYMCNGIVNLIKEPLRKIETEDNRYGIEIFGYYRVFGSPDTPFVEYQINKSNLPFNESGYELYQPEYNKQFLVHNEERINDFKWIFDLEITGSKGNYDSHRWGITSKLNAINYVDLAIFINIAAYFDMFDYLDHGLLVDIEECRNGYVGYRDERREVAYAFDRIATLIRSKHIDSLKGFFGEIGEDVWCRKLHISIVDGLKRLLNNQWRRRFHLQNKRLRLSDYDYFVRRYAPYEESINRVEKYSKAQAFYLFFMQVDAEAFNDLNYFSHQNKVTNINECHTDFGFPQKSALKYFNQLSTKFLEEWFDIPRVNNIESRWLYFVETVLMDYEYRLPLQSVRREKLIKQRWLALMYWLSYGVNFNKSFKKTPAITKDFLKCLNTDDVLEHGIQLAKVFDAFFNFEEGEAKAIKEWKADPNRNPEFTTNTLEYFELTCNRQRQYFLDFICSREHEQLDNIYKIDRSATYKSALRKSDEWHEEINQRNLEESLSEKPLEIFTSIDKNPYTVDSATFTPLLSNRDMIKEAITMKHCVDVYTNAVMEGDYVVYHVESESEKATLGIKIGEKKPFTLDQFFGVENKEVSESLMKTAQKFIRKLNNKAAG